MYLHLDVLATYIYTCHDFFSQLVNNTLTIAWDMVVLEPDLTHKRSGSGDEAHG